MGHGLIAKCGLSMLALIAASGIELGVRKHKMKPGFACTIPDYNYTAVVQKQIATMTAVSRQAIPVESSVPVLVTADPQTNPPVAKSVNEIRRLKYFQFEQPTFALDHCSISRVIATLDENQNWSLSLRAGQNLQPIGAVPIGADPRTLKQTGHFKRNEFTVNVRFLGSYQSPAENPGTTAGRPVVLRTEPISFWVQNGEPLDVRRTGQLQSTLGNLATFGVVDRIEIDFSYR